MDKEKNIRVRFAPSPTGYLHVGSLRTALFNFLFARKNNGTFVLRIEDTDKTREVAGAIDHIVKTLQFFGLDFDEGPYRQSSRLAIYKKHIDQLLEKGVAYKCYCSQERIAKLKEEAKAAGVAFKYDKHCLTSPQPSPNSEREKYVIRQNIPDEGVTEFTDLVYGKISIENRKLDDGVLIKSDGFPVYNFANVVDDHLMEISHVIRGEEFISSTPKHVLLYQAFGWDLPEFIHLPLILDTQRKKLSKRSGDVAVEEYLKQGYLPEAILNFVAFLGWNPKSEREIFTLDELVSEFGIEKINKAGAIFDTEKLKWFNSHYIKTKSPEELLKLSRWHLPATARDYPDEFLEAIMKLEQERLQTLSEIGERVEYFFRTPEYDKEMLQWKNATNEEIKTSLEKAEKIISNFQFPISKKDIEKFFLDEIGEGDKGTMLWPLRVALTGLKASPSPFEILEVLMKLGDKGKEEVINRVNSAVEKL